MRLARWKEIEPRGEDRKTWRNVLAQYDAIVYEIEPGPVDEVLQEALVAWPGILVLRGGDLERFFAGDPALSARALERASAVVVDSPGLAERLHAEHPWANVVTADRAADLGRLARRSARAWLEPLFESAAAEIPGYFPGDRSSPWRAEVEELVTLRQTGANVSRRTTRSPR